MIMILLILLALTCIGLKRTDAHEECLRKENTDAIKGFFIIIVFYSHILPYLTNSGVSFSPILDIPFNRIIRLTGQLMVVMFLFYSGYGVMESIRVKGDGYIQSIPVKRVLSTLVNYDIAVIVFLCMNLLLGIHYPAGKYALSLIAWDSVGQSNWYIFAILCCYASTFISFSLFRKQMYAFASTVFLLLIYIVVMHEFKETWWYNIILSYPAGMTVSLYKKQLLSVLERHYVISVTALMLLFIPLFHYRSFTPVHLAVSVIFAFLIFSVSYKVVINNRILSWCGKNLFMLYVYQRIPMIALSTLFPYFVRLHPYIYVTCCLAVTLLFAVLIKPVSVTSKN